MLIDRGLLVEERGTYRAKGSLDALEVPESLHALIAARLDSLAGHERSLLQDAAVLGKSFTVPALSAVTNIPESEVEAVLTTLVGEGPPGDPVGAAFSGAWPVRLRAGPDPQRRTRERFARRERKLRHLAAATYLASSWTEDEEIAEVVAAHLVDAYDADPAASALQKSASTQGSRSCGSRARGSLGGATSAQHY